MTCLIVSFPKKSYCHDSDKGRLVYKVGLDSGKLISLGQFCSMVKVPYTSVAKAIYANLATCGTHERAFLQIIADVKKRMHKPRADGAIPCSHCQGSGKEPSVTQVPTS